MVEIQKIVIVNCFLSYICLPVYVLEILVYLYPLSPFIVLISFWIAGDAGKDECEDDSGSDTEDLGEADEDESDLDLAWKMLDLARAIVEKDPADTMEKVEILSALAEVALERG